MRQGGVSSLFGTCERLEAALELRRVEGRYWLLDAYIETLVELGAVQLERNPVPVRGEPPVGDRYLALVAAATK